MAANNKKRTLPQWKRNALSGAITLALAGSGLYAAPAFSDPCASSITTSVDQCEAGGTATITITGTGEVLSTSTGDAAIYVDDATGVTLDNSGSIIGGWAGIDVDAEATGTTITNRLGGLISGSWTGIYYDGGALDGTLTNAGTISVDDSNSWAVGVYADGDLSGTLTNSGTITATAFTSYSYATAYGVYVDDNLTGTLTNSGTISATALNSYSYATAYGVYVDDNLTGTLTNSGTISALAEATYPSEAYAYGVYVGGNLTGTLTNSGSITATATGNSATAYGVYVDGDLSGTSLTNSGTISASANAYSWASAYGVYVGDMLSGLLRNTGTISASAISDYSSASAEGVYIWTIGAGGTLTNAGTISASANAYSWAGAYGVNTTHWNEGGTLTNSGTISASAASTGGGSYASAYGVAVWNLDGTLTNSGAISATASGDTWASAFGVHAYAVGATGVVTNTGTISASASAVDLTSEAAGFYSWNMDGTLTNSGRIFANVDVAGDPADAYSIYVDSGGSGTINNLAGGVLGSILGGIGGGRLYVDGTVAVNNAGTIAIPAGAGGYIAGDYTQLAGGVLQIGAIDDTDYGSLEVGGTADLTGSNTIAVRVAVDNTLAEGDELDNVLTAGTWAGLASGGTVNVIGTPLFTFTGVEDGGGSIDLTLASVNNFGGALGSLGNSSLDGVAGTLDDLVGEYTGDEDLDPLIEALYGLNTLGEMGDAVQQLTPLMAGGMTQVTANTLRDAGRIIEARQDANLGLSSGDVFYGDRKFWIKPFGSWAEQDNRDGVPGYDADTYGFALGVDGEMSATTRIGAAFTYANSDVDATGAARQNADVDSYQATLYGSHSMDDRTHMNFQAGLGLHNTDGRRYIDIPVPAVASSDYDSLSVHLGAGIARINDIGPKTTFTPSLRADYTSIRDGSYTETGAGPLNLSVNKNTTDALIFAVDGKFVHAVSDSTRLTANIGVGYDVLGEQASLTSTFVGGGPAFTTRGLDPSPLLVRGGLGLLMTNSNALEVTARYDIEAREDFTNQTASINVRLPF